MRWIAVAGCLMGLCGCGTPTTADGDAGGLMGVWQLREYGGTGTVWTVTVPNPHAGGSGTINADSVSNACTLAFGVIRCNFHVTAEHDNAFDGVASCMSTAGAQFDVNVSLTTADGGHLLRMVGGPCSITASN